MQVGKLQQENSQQNNQIQNLGNKNSQQDAQINIIEDKLQKLERKLNSESIKVQYSILPSLVHRRFDVLVAWLGSCARNLFVMHMCVGKCLAETVSKTGAQRQKWSGRVIFKLLARRRSNFC